MNDLAVPLEALKTRLLLAAGRRTDALKVAQAAMEQLRPGIELAHLVPFSYGLALAAAGREAEGDRYLQMAHDQLLAALGDLPQAQREAALAAVPGHREVLAAWGRRRTQQAVFHLARAEAPSGRPLEPEERMAVTWTLHTPDDSAIADLVQRRRARLLRLLEEAASQGGAPTVDDLADALEASVATVRRDLAALRRSGHPATTRGSRRRS
jgi:hypothetical protein